MLAWQTGVYSQADWQGLAEVTFNQQAGIDPGQWQVQVANSTFGDERLAVATSRNLLQDLRELFKRQHLPLVRCTPLLTAVAQRY
ncbi:hypothetical protein, partial [Colwellia ponticola]|uniref:hypothetical protein n=2 Tax=Gammaproteobacteria TaxID=1236 RepID=UPI001CA45228